MRVDEEVGPVAERDRGRELRRVRVERDREQLDGLALPQREDGLERLELVVAVRVPEEDGRGERARRREERERCQRGEREDQTARLIGAPLMAPRSGARRPLPRVEEVHRREARRGCCRPSSPPLSASRRATKGAPPSDRRARTSRSRAPRRSTRRAARPRPRRRGDVVRAHADRHLAPGLERAAEARLVDAMRTSPAGDATARRPSALERPSTKFIAGVPRKPATKRVAGRS